MSLLMSVKRLLLARVAVAQSSSLSLFTNRDAELEQRAMLLKRLAFTIYSSEVDQYQKYLPDIQGEHNKTLHSHYKARSLAELCLRDLFTALRFYSSIRIF